MNTVYLPIPKSMFVAWIPFGKEKVHQDTRVIMSQTIYTHSHTATKKNKTILATLNHWGFHEIQALTKKSAANSRQG